MVSTILITIAAILGVLFAALYFYHSKFAVPAICTAFTFLIIGVFYNKEQNKQMQAQQDANDLAKKHILSYAKVKLFLS